MISGVEVFMEVATNHISVFKEDLEDALFPHHIQSLMTSVSSHLNTVYHSSGGAGLPVSVSCCQF